MLRRDRKDGPARVPRSARTEAALITEGPLTPYGAGTDVSARPSSSPERARTRTADHAAPLPLEEPPSTLQELPLVEVDVAAVGEDHWIREIRSRWNVRLRFDVCRPVGPDASRLLQMVQLTGDPGDLGAVERFLRRRPEIRALTVMALSPSRRLLRVVSPMPGPCRGIFEIGAICGTCLFNPPAGSDGTDRWRLVVPRTQRALQALARSSSPQSRETPKVLRVRRFVPKQTLTPRQAAALETAYRLGFYAFPRRTNLKEISRILGISRSSAAELLRRGESKMLAPELSEP